MNPPAEFMRNGACRKTLRVDQVLSNWPVEIVIVDYDLEGLDDDEVRKVMGEEAFVYRGIEASEVNTGVARQVFKDICR